MADTIKNASVSLLATTIFLLAANGRQTFAQTANHIQATNNIYILEIQGSVEVLSANKTAWEKPHNRQILHPFDRLHTDANSRVVLHWTDESIIPFGASTELEILPPNSAENHAGLHLIRGILSFFHRDKPGRIQIITRGAIAGVEGTEFVLDVDPTDRTTLSVIDGKVRLSNDEGYLSLTNGEQAVTKPGKAPARTVGFIANNLLQWCFYYPAVVDPDELQFTDNEQAALSDSLAAYRNGNLLAALASYPVGRTNISDQERVYRAALHLSVGEVKSAETILSAVAPNSVRPRQLSTALRQLIAAVKRQPEIVTNQPQLASEAMAASYLEQSRAERETSLQNALHLALQAVSRSPRFGFAWERVAEIEFSFGRMNEALGALDKSLALAPYNAQGLALKGFVLAAQNRPREAYKWFDRAITADSALGNAWLGRGLVRIRLGDITEGREDLLVAAALEPQRAELRSYLGKAYIASGNDVHARKELSLAKNLDANDPTAWLYSALHNQQNNEINDAIRDLEKSQALNDNRAVYRSQLLLDQDSAVRRANLAGIYQDAGMFDVSLREAGRAVSSDYANYSAHLFLANSYAQLNDPNLANLRYETPKVSEFWIANLLAPASAGIQSPLVSQQPYSRLFQQNRFGIASDTTYLSRGAWTESGAQFGTFDNFSYNLETSYTYDPGQRSNNDIEDRDLVFTLKYQFTPQDNVFITVEQVQINSGDVNEYYGHPSAPTDVRFSESQDPNWFLGYHHEWGPGVQTLLLMTKENGNTSTRTDEAGHWVGWYSGNAFTAVRQLTDHNLLAISPEEYSTELQQIWETPNHTTILGARYFWGDLRFQNIEWYPASGIGGVFLGILGSDNPNPKYPFEIANQYFADDFQHLSLYGYHDWQITDSLKLSAGISYDSLEQPAVVDMVPFSPQNKTTVQISPKAGIIWTPRQNTTFRAAYTRSLSGFINDASVRLEPTEVAGFNQAYRSVIPDTVIGDTSGSQLDTFDLSLEQKFDTGTYLAISGEILYSKLLKKEGAYVFYADSPLDYPIFPDGLRRSLDYHELSLTFSADQLIGKQWVAGARYRVSQANLNASYVDIPANLPASEIDPPFQAHQKLESVLHTINLHANWNHPSGLFSIFEGNWYHQNNLGFSPTEPGDDFCQFNVYAGYRFWHRRAEFTLGLLNVGDQNYRLEPLNLYDEMARSRTLLARLRFNF